jgi:alpha-galactosidase
MSLHQHIPVLLLVVCAVPRAATSQSALRLAAVRNGGGHAVAASRPGPNTGLELRRGWDGDICHSTLVNGGDRPVRVHEVVVASIPHTLPPDTPMWGEGFQMLTQTGGTIGRPVDLGFYADRGMYRIPQPADATTVYNLLAISPRGGKAVVFGFTSCRRFSGTFRLYAGRIDAVLDMEDLEIAPGEAWPLEEMVCLEGTDRHTLLAEFATRVTVHHPRLVAREIPTGWCSWYCFGAKVTSRQLEANLGVIQSRLPGLKYLQIDDGYQATTGDWLVTRPDFGGDIADACRRIRAAGLQPAIWLAPFVADGKSRVFQEHPDWFVQDAGGKPLRSDRVTFGGWHQEPWYVLDTTHPGACTHLEHIFHTMHREWGCTYFKLDALYWGAMHGGHRHDRGATRVEAYRRGMQAILRGAGDSFILGCNHPLWPSLGLVHGARTSMDIQNGWDCRRRTAIESFHRNWEHGRLWVNDPDVLTLAGDYSREDLRLRAAVIFASGGLVMAGDDLARLPEERLALIRRLLPPTGVAARFNDDFTVGWAEASGQATAILFNWTDQPAE